MSQRTQKHTDDYAKWMKKKDKEIAKLQRNLSATKNAPTTPVNLNDDDNSHTSIRDVSEDQHHERDHADTHEKDEIDELTIRGIGSPTYDTPEDLFTVLHSAGLVSGGELTDTGSEEITVAAGTGFIRNDDDPLAPLLAFDWAEETNLAIPTNSSRHIGIEYNDGSPRVLVTATHTDFNEHDNFHLADVVNEDGTLHLQFMPHEIGDAIGHLIERLVDTLDPAVADGLILGESQNANRYVTMTAGSMWLRLTKNIIAAFNSAGADRFDIYYRDNPTGFIKVADQQSWDMDSYDDGSGTLQTLTGPQHHAVIWFYVEFDGELVAQYGRDQYVTQALAENEPVPNSAPDRITEHATLIGRLIFKKNTTPAVAVETVFVDMFNSAGVTSHTGLADVNGAADVQHLNADQITALHAEVTDLDHDALTNFEADEHLTTGAINHNVLANLNTGDVFKHISAAQLAALHASHIFGDVDEGTDFNSHAEQIKAGFVLYGGGTITVDGSYRVGWTTRFLVIDAGRGSHFSTEGFFDIDQPTSGTIAGAGGGTENTWNANGIIIPNWQALYYILPIGSDKTSIPGNFRMVDYHGDLEIPDEWLFLAGHNADHHHIKFGVGLMLNASETWIMGTSSMINTVASDLDHQDIANRSADDHHTKTTDADIVNAIEAATTLDLIGDVNLTDSTKKLTFNNALEIFHNSAFAAIDNSNSLTNLYLKAATTKSIILQLGGDFGLLDVDDGFAILVSFATGTRLWEMGTTTDNVAFKLAGNIGFFDTTPQSQSSPYTPTNVVTTRSYDANATSLEELADVLGTLILDLQTYGLIG